MENRKSKRSLRVALVLGAAVAGTALVGWGGLAAWSAYTENAGNSVAAGTLTHNNYVSSNCASTLGTAPVGVGPAGAPRSSPSPVRTRPTTSCRSPAPIKIDNTGNLKSTFSMSMPAAATGGLCADLTLKVTRPLTWGPGHPVRGYRPDLDHDGRDQRLQQTPPRRPRSGRPTASAGTGTGATGNTFTFTVASGRKPSDQLRRLRAELHLQHPLHSDGRLSNALIRKAGAGSPAPASCCPSPAGAPPAPGSIPQQRTAQTQLSQSQHQAHPVTRLWRYRTGLREIDPPRLHQ
jgi:hypothetical protein